MTSGADVGGMDSGHVPRQVRQGQVQGIEDGRRVQAGQVVRWEAGGHSCGCITVAWKHKTRYFIILTIFCDFNFM